MCLGLWAVFSRPRGLHGSPPAPRSPLKNVSPPAAQMADVKPATPIASLFDFGNHVIEATVVSKRNLAQGKTGRDWFSFVLSDATGDIKVSCFNNAPQFFGSVPVGAVVRLENVTIRSKSESDRKYDSSSSEYAVTLKADSQITVLQTPEQAAAAPQDAKVLIPTISLDDAHQTVSNKLPQDAPDDAVVTHTGNIVAGIIRATFRASAPDAPRPWRRVDLQVRDATNSVKVGIWGDGLLSFVMRHPSYFGSSKPGPVTAADAEQIIAGLSSGEDIAGLSDKICGLSRLTFRFSRKYQFQAQDAAATKIFMDDEMSFLVPYQDLKTWWTSEGAKSLKAMPMSPARGQGGEGGRQSMDVMPLEYLKDADLDGVHRVLASVTIDWSSSDRATYSGCSVCKRAYRPESGNMCANCARETAPQNYYRVPITITDFSQSHRSTLFDPHATEVVGIGANEFAALEPQDRERRLSKSFEAECLLRIVHGADGKDKLNVVTMRVLPNYDSLLRVSLAALFQATGVSVPMK